MLYSKKNFNLFDIKILISIEYDNTTNDVKLTTISQDIYHTWWKKKCLPGFIFQSFCNNEMMRKQSLVNFYFDGSCYVLIIGFSGNTFCTIVNVDLNWTHVLDH